MPSQALQRPPHRRSIPANPLGYDFALLGLRANESRVSVIRRAAAQTALRIHEAEVDAQEQAAMLSHVAVSTYRLLDPRRREESLERVRLCVLSEDDFDLQRHSRLPLWSSTQVEQASSPEQRLDRYHVSSAAV